MNSVLSGLNLSLLADIHSLTSYACQGYDSSHVRTDHRAVRQNLKMQTCSSLHI